MPRLRINIQYAGDSAAHAAPAARRCAAAGGALFVKAHPFQQRFDTIQRAPQAIVEHQKDFFTHGAIAVKPLRCCARSRRPSWPARVDHLARDDRQVHGHASLSATF